MKIPRGISGTDVIKALKRFGYSQTRQVGSHIRITTLRNGEHHITVPNHDPIKIGTISSIIRDVAEHFNMTKDEVAAMLWS